MSTVTINQQDIVNDLVDEVELELDRDGSPLLKTKHVRVYMEDWVPTQIKGEKYSHDVTVPLVFTFEQRYLDNTYQFLVEIAE